MRDNRVPVQDRLFNFAFVLCLCGSFFSQITGVRELRYLSYMGVVFGFIFCFGGINKWRALPPLVKPFLILCLYAGLSCLANPNDMVLSVSYLVFWLSAVAMFLPHYKFSVSITTINLIYFVVEAFLIDELHFGYSMLDIMKGSVSTAETNTGALVFPPFFIYHLFRGNKLMACLNLLAVILFFKRITFLAVGVALMIYVLQRIFAKNELKRVNPWLFVILNFFYLVVTIEFARGAFDHLLRMTGIGVGELSMGRNFLYQKMGDALYNSDLLHILFGHGAGASFDLLTNLHTTDVHNDVLKLVYDCGVFVWCAFFYLLYKAVNSWTSFTLIVTLNICFLTDNTLIYTIVLMTYFLISQDKANYADNENDTQNDDDEEGKVSLA